MKKVKKILAEEDFWKEPAMKLTANQKKKYAVIGRNISENEMKQMEWVNKYTIWNEEDFNEHINRLTSSLEKYKINSEKKVFLQFEKGNYLIAKKQLLHPTEAKLKLEPKIWQVNTITQSERPISETSIYEMAISYSNDVIKWINKHTETLHSFEEKTEYNTQIFTVKGSLLFTELLSCFETEIQKTPLAYLSFIYWKLKEEKFLHKTVSSTNFMEFLREEHKIILDKLKTLLACTTTAKKNGYSTCKLKLFQQS